MRSDQSKTQTCEMDVSNFFLQLPYAALNLPFCDFDNGMILSESKREYAPAQVVPVNDDLAAS